MPFGIHDSVWPLPQHECFHAPRRYEGRREKSQKVHYRPHLPLRQPSVKCESWCHSLQLHHLYLVQGTESLFAGFGWGRNFLQVSVTCYCAVNHPKIEWLKTAPCIGSQHCDFSKDWGQWLVSVPADVAITWLIPLGVIQESRLTFYTWQLDPKKVTVDTSRPLQC